MAEQLSVFDSMIDNNSGRIELLEQAAQELYREWFVRFRFPGYENAKFEDGLPENWSYVRFGKTIEIIDGDRGVNYPKQEEFYPEGDCLFLNAGNVTAKGFDFSSCSYITKEKTLFFVRVNYSMVMLFSQPGERLVMLLFTMKL